MIGHRPPPVPASGAAPGDVEGTARASTAAAGDPERAVALVLGLLSLLVLVAYLPGLSAPSVSTATVIALAVAGPGVVILVRLVLRGDRPARWLAAYLLWATAATVAADRPLLSVYGGIATSGGLLYLVAYGGWWAVGRASTARARSHVTAALVLGMLVNVAVAIVQVSVTSGSGLLHLEYDRATGLFTNPVYFGGALAGAVPLVAALAVRSTSRWWGWLPVLAAFGAATNLSGSRAALLAGGAMAALALRRAPWVRIASIAAALVVGFLLAAGATPSVGSGRLADGEAAGSGIRPRLTMWEAGLAAVPDHPVLGIGPGRFRVIGTREITAAFVRAEGPDLAYFDAHSLPVEQVVTVGIPGLILVAGFTWGAARRARGPLAWFAGGVALTWLLEPTAVMTGSLALLALGLADHRPTDEEPPPPASAAPPPSTGRAASAPAVARVLAAAGLAVVGLVIGLRGVAADSAYTRSRSSYDLADVRRARDLVPRDPTFAAWEASLLLTEANRDPSPANRRRALDATERFVDLDPADPRAWSSLALVTFLHGDRATSQAEALRLYREALERNPWSAVALHGAWDMARLEGEEAAQAGYAERLCEIDLCPAPPG